ncbi:GTP-binding protein [Streptomyces sp. SID1121]|uniref:GTP-binding protein n=1 Tax=Streptomyces sp. SID1121 TaxID=3425888 RepID=UPI0040563391
MPPPEEPPLTLKIVIAGGFAAGKTTAIGAVSEIPTLNTEEFLTTASLVTDQLTGTEDKNSTTVAMDFGKITLGDLNVVLMLFGTPGQPRFRYFWQDLANGSLGAIVLADTRNLPECFPALDFFERRETPFVVAVNEFDASTHRYTTDEVRAALRISPAVPVVLCDARQRESMAGVLTTLVRHALDAARLHQPTPLPQEAHQWVSTPPPACTLSATTPSGRSGYVSTGRSG